MSKFLLRYKYLIAFVVLAILAGFWYPQKGMEAFLLGAFWTYAFIGLYQQEHKHEFDRKAVEEYLKEKEEEAMESGELEASGVSAA